MDFISLFLIAIGLAADAFAVSVSNGISLRNFTKKHALKLAIFFGLFQFIMPVIGFFLGSSVEKYVEKFDHWIAFCLLVVLGVIMIVENIRQSLSSEIIYKEVDEALTYKIIIFQAIATSIDALAVGISFAALDKNIWISAVVIGIVAFILSYVGAMSGKKLAGFIQKRATFIGGLILIAIGMKILLEHLF